MSSFQDADLFAIQRFKATIFALTRDSIKFKREDSNLTYPCGVAILHSVIYHGSMEILEDAVRNKKKLWLIVEVRTSSNNNIGKSFFLSDAHYLDNTDEIDEVNPSKR